MKYTDYRDILEDELSTRRQNNPAYSVRAFARDLGISSPRLSNILNKKQGLSVESAREIAKRLKIPEGKKRWFYLSAGALHSRSDKERKEFQKKIKEIKNESKVYSEISMEYFTIVSEWYHFAILELTLLKTFQYDIQWIANTLGIDPQNAQDAIERMKRLDLVQEKNGTLVATHQYIESPDEMASSALKKFNSQLIQASLRAITEQPVHEREISSILIGIEKSRLPELKERLKDFRREFSYEAAKGDNKDTLYCLATQFYSLSKESR